jgi:DNA replication regulator DPB11
LSENLSDPILKDNMLVSLSSLDTFERTWVSRLLRLLGVQISASFSAQCTHLLCPTRNGVKCKKAEEWSIPVVDLDWLKQLTTMAATAKERRTASPETNHAQQLPMEKSMEAMKLDIKAPAPSLELLTRQGAVSPVFKVATPTGSNGFARPPSPHSPSPQGKRVIQPRAGISETNGSAKPAQRILTSSVTKAGNQTPVRHAITQRVPSSASPSPLRMQGPVTIAAKEPVALPSTISFQLTSAKALSKNIGAVLGSKRSADEDSEGGVGVTNATDGGPRKRPRRPQPSLARVGQCPFILLNLTHIVDIEGTFSQEAFIGDCIAELRL